MASLASEIKLIGNGTPQHGIFFFPRQKKAIKRGNSSGFFALESKATSAKLV